MRDDDNTNNFNYLIVDLDNRSLMIDDFENLQRKDCFDDEIIK